MIQIGELALSGALLAVLVLEVVKYLLRKYRYGEDFDFPPKFYDYMIPFLTFVFNIALGKLGLGPEQVFSLAGLVSWGLSIPAELFIYHTTLKGYKEYRKEYRAKNDASAKDSESVPVG